MEMRLDSLETPQSVIVVSDNEREAFDLGAIVATLLARGKQHSVGEEDSHIAVSFPLVSAT